MRKRRNPPHKADEEPKVWKHSATGKPMTAAQERRMEEHISELDRRSARRSCVKSLPLSEEAKKAGVKWLMADGVKTVKEARRLERIFVSELKKVNPADIIRDQVADVNKLRRRLGLPPVKNVEEGNAWVRRLLARDKMIVRRYKKP